MALYDPQVRQNGKNMRIATDACCTQFGVPERHALEVPHLIRSQRNETAPINRMPPEILTLLPDFWNARDRDQDVIALTHVCRAWREVFISHSALWTNFDCEDLDKTLVYLERSKSSPINLSLYRDNDPFLNDPLFHVIPHAVGRLKSLSVRGTPWNLRDITSQLSRRAPLLEEMSIHGSCGFEPEDNLVLTSALFDGDLSSLCKLHLEHVITDLAWRNMANLASLVLVHTFPVSMGQLLDFFESAPHLREVNLRFETPTSSARSGRLVPLAWLKKMCIAGGPSSALLDHLLIPVGARLAIEVDLSNPSIVGHPPRFLDNLRNLDDFNTIKLHGGSHLRVQFNGPNGEVYITITPTFRVRCTCDSLLESLTHFDTSKAKRLELGSGCSPSGGFPFRALLPMNDLRTLALYQCETPYPFIYALNPSVGLSGVMVCPKLEELVIEPQHGLNIRNVVGMAAAREFRGAKLKSVRVLGQRGYAQVDVLALKKYVGHVECGR